MIRYVVWMDSSAFRQSILVLISSSTLPVYGSMLRYVVWMDSSAFRPSMLVLISSSAFRKWGREMNTGAPRKIITIVIAALLSLLTNKECLPSLGISDLWQLNSGVSRCIRKVSHLWQQTLEICLPWSRCVRAISVRFFTDTI